MATNDAIIAAPTSTYNPLSYLPVMLIDKPMINGESADTVLEIPFMVPPAIARESVFIIFCNNVHAGAVPIFVMPNDNANKTAAIYLLSIIVDKYIPIPPARSANTRNGAYLPVLSTAHPPRPFNIMDNMKGNDDNHPISTQLNPLDAFR